MKETTGFSSQNVEGKINETPALIKICQNLTKVAVRGNDLSNEISHKLRSIKQDDSISGELDDRKEIPSQSAVDDLYRLCGLFENNNRVLESCLRHLNQII